MDVQIPRIGFEVDTNISVPCSQYRIEIGASRSRDRDRRRREATARIGQTIRKAIAAIEGRRGLIGKRTIWLKRQCALCRGCLDRRRVGPDTVIPFIVECYGTAQHLLAIYIERIISSAQRVDVEDHRLDAAFDVRVNDWVVDAVAIAIEETTDNHINFILARLAKGCIEVAMCRGTQPNVVGAAQPITGSHPQSNSAAKQDRVKREIAAA